MTYVISPGSARQVHFAADLRVPPGRGRQMRRTVLSDGVICRIIVRHSCRAERSLTSDLMVVVILSRDGATACVKEASGGGEPGCLRAGRWPPCPAYRTGQAVNSSGGGRTRAAMRSGTAPELRCQPCCLLAVTSAPGACRPDRTSRRKEPGQRVRRRLLPGARELARGPPCSTLPDRGTYASHRLARHAPAGKNRCRAGQPSRATFHERSARRVLSRHRYPERNPW
jgi:hypothetical protein